MIKIAYKSFYIFVILSESIWFSIFWF